MRKNKFKKLFSKRNAPILIVCVILVLLATLAVSLWQKSYKENMPLGAVSVSDTFRWTGKAGDGKWSSAANWDQDRVPSTNARVIFDATSSQDSSVDPDFGGKIASLEIEGYMAKIKQDTALTIDGDYYQASGAYEAAGSMEVNGNFTQTGESIFTPTSGDTRIAGDFAYNDGFKPPVEEAMVFVKVNDEWKSLTITKNGAKDYYAVKETNSTPMEVWSFYNATNFLQSYVSLEKGWSLGGADKAWGWNYVFVGLQREGKGVSAAGKAGISAQENRITLRRDENTEEWYENTYKGIEQGFTIWKKPAGEGELVIKGSVITNNMSAAKDKSGDIVGTLLPGGNTVFKYGHLLAEDAQGKNLPVTMSFVEAGEGKYELDISVDDSGAQYPIIVDPIATTPDWTGSLNKASSQYGKVATLVGDVNGDGRSDFLVTARTYVGTATAESNEGAAFLYYGTEWGISNTPAWSYESNIIDAEFGHSASAAGDVNNDGYDDFIVGADGVNGFSGRIYLFLGGPAFELTNKGPSWTYDGPLQLLQKLGQSVSNAGDVNGDGYDDIIAGAHFFDGSGFTDQGKVLVFYGNNTARGLSDIPDWTVAGWQNNAILGFSVSEAGDVNKDGYGDILIGAPMYNGNGAAYLYFGDVGGLGVKPPQTFTHTNNGYASGAYFGNPVSPGGDLNNDGALDILIGSSRYDIGTSTSNEGAVFAYYGGAGGFSNTPGWSSYGIQPGAYYGSGLYTAGDVNGDGFSDIIVGACMYNGLAGLDTGKAWLFLGAGGGLGAGSVWSIEGRSAGANLGWYASTAGNVNGDESGDFLVSAYNYNAGTVGGQAYLFYGGDDDGGYVPEICNNGVDDNGNGIADSAEPSCAVTTDQKSLITVTVSTKDEDNWLSDECNYDTNADGLKDRQISGCAGPLGAYLQCDMNLGSYDSKEAKNSYAYFRDYKYTPCNRDNVHDDFKNIDSTSPVFVQPVDQDFTIKADAMDFDGGIQSIKIQWLNGNTVSSDASKAWSNLAGSRTCSFALGDIATCSVCIKGGDCGAGNDIIDPASLGIQDGQKQQRLFFRVITTDNAAIPHVLATGYDDDTTGPVGSVVYDKYYRLHICSSACHSCVNTAPTVTLDKYEEPDFCQGLGYKLYWVFADPDGQSSYELQLQDKNNPAAPILSTMRTSSAKSVTITEDLLSGKLEYGKTYKWRVRAYDNSAEAGCRAVSAWTPWSSELAIDKSFQTPSRYPIPSFTISGSNFNTDITFTSDSNIYSTSPNPATYHWYIDLGTTTIEQTTDAAFMNFADETYPTHDIRMVVTDGEGHHCELSKELKLGKKYPVWNEVAPLQD